MATKKELERIVELLKEQAKSQSSVSNSLGDYIDGLKKAKSINEEVSRLRKIELDIQTKLTAAAAAGNMKKVREHRLTLKLLKEQTDELEHQGKVLEENLKRVKKGNLLAVATVTSIGKGLAKIPGIIQQGYGSIKGLGLFEMDKAIKKAALSMGVLSKENIGFRDGLKRGALYSNQLGVSLEDLAKMQADYSDELGRNVVLSDKGLEAMTQLSTVVGLGAEGAAKMAADMETQGYSAERTRDFVKETLNDTHKMGLNASKIIKNIQQNIKLLNKYNFKGGVKGLAKMAETTSKLGVDMSFATSMADKLFDIDGAVEMSAQLQVMGGEWSKLADPFKLMYLARNDVNGLTEALGKAAESAVHLNKDGDFEISALEMHRLRKVAEQLGVSYEDLAQAGKQAAKFTKIKSQINFSLGSSKEDKELGEYLTNKAIFKDGKTTILVNGNPKLLKTLSAEDKKILRAQSIEQQSIEERAKASLTFDDALKNTINIFKVTLLPLIEEMNKTLLPKIENLVKRFKDEHWADKIEAFAKQVGVWISKFAGMLIDNPLTTGIAYLTTKGLGFLMEKAGWVLNGLALAQGFNMGTKGGGLMDAIPGGKGMRVGAEVMASGKTLKGLGIMTKSLGKFVAPLAAIGVGLDAYTNSQDDSLTTGQAVGKTLDQNKFMAIGAGIGSLFGGVGAIPGAGIGAIIDMIANTSGGDNALIGNHIGGGLYNKKANDAILSGGKLTPLDKKDDILAMKPNGAVDNVLKTKENKINIIKHEFGAINISGDITVSSPGGESQSIDLVKDPIFIRNITKMIHSETEKVIKGGKN